MNTTLKMMFLIIVIFIIVIAIDTIQARIFKHSPLISWKESLEDSARTVG